MLTQISSGFFSANRATEPDGGGPEKDYEYMKTMFGKFIFAISAMLATATPAFGTAILSMINSTNGGTITTSNGTVTGLTGVPLNTLTYGSSVYTLTNTTESLSGLVLTVSGEVFNGSTALTGLGTIQNLFTITFASALTNISGATSTTLNTPFVGTGAPLITSVTANTSLLSDLGLTGYVPSVLGGGDQGTGSVSNGTGTYGSTSNSLTILLNAPAPTPEPASMFLMGSGLMAGVLLVRRRKSAVRA